MELDVDFDSFYRDELLPELRELEKQRLEKWHPEKIIENSTAVGIWFVIAIISWANLFRFFAILCAVALLGLILFGRLNLLTDALESNSLSKFFVDYREPERAYKRAYKRQIITKIIAAFNTSLTFKPEWHIDQSYFEYSELIRGAIDRYEGEDLIEGRIGQTDVHISQLVVENWLKPNTRTTVGAFRGIFCVIDFHKSFHGELFILPEQEEQLLGKFVSEFVQFHNRRRPELIKLEDPEFEQLFTVYGTDQVEARYILSTSMMRRLVQLKQRVNGKIRLSFKGGDAYIAIEHMTDILEPAVDTLATDKAQIRRFFHEIKFLLSIVEELNLNTDIWPKSYGKTDS